MWQTLRSCLLIIKHNSGSDMSMFHEIATGTRGSTEIATWQGLKFWRGSSIPPSPSPKTGPQKLKTREGRHKLRTVYMYLMQNVHFTMVLIATKTLVGFYKPLYLPLSLPLWGMGFLVHLHVRVIVDLLLGFYSKFFKSISIYFIWEPTPPPSSYTECSGKDEILNEHSFFLINYGL